MSELHDVLAALQVLADEAFALTATIEADVAKRFASSQSRGALTVVEPLVREAMTAPSSHIQGAGFVSAIGLLKPERWWLEWFIRDDDNRVNRLDVQRDPDAIGFYDYTHSPWYAVPESTGRPHITGPYVDNLCTADYTLTFTQPLIADGVFLGVSGADIGVRTAERKLLPVLQAMSRRAAVVNADGRVLVSNTGALMCGDLVEPGVVPVERLELADLPLFAIALDH